MFSGRFATVNGIGNVNTWSLSESVEEDKIINSATHGGTDRIFGDKDVTGSITCHGALPPVMPGDLFVFKGYTSPTTGVFGSTGIVYTLDAVCTSIAITWDYSANKAVKYTMQFAAMGLMTVAVGPASVDNTTVKKIKSRDCKMVYGTTPTELLIYRTTATLTLTNAVTTRSDASTLGWKVRELGPLDWTLAVVTNGHDKYLAPGQYLKDLKIGIAPLPSTDAYWFSDAIVGQSTDITLTADGTAIDTQTVNIHMAASTDTGILGFIRKPGELVANWWPPLPGVLEDPAALGNHFKEDKIELPKTESGILLPKDEAKPVTVKADVKHKDKP